MAGKTPNVHFADRPLADAVQQSFPTFGEVPKNTAQGGVTASNGDVGGGGTVNISGDHVSVSAAGSWWKAKGYQVAAWFGVKW